MCNKLPTDTGLGRVIGHAFLGSFTQTTANFCLCLTAGLQPDGFNRTFLIVWLRKSVGSELCRKFISQVSLEAAVAAKTQHMTRPTLCQCETLFSSKHTGEIIGGSSLPPDYFIALDFVNFSRHPLHSWV